MMEVTLHSTGCPQCEVIKSKLKNNSIKFNENSDVEEMKNKGIYKVPVLEVDGRYMGILEANLWINSHANGA